MTRHHTQHGSFAECDNYSALGADGLTGRSNSVSPHSVNGVWDCLIEQCTELLIYVHLVGLVDLTTEGLKTISGSADKLVPHFRRQMREVGKSNPKSDLVHDGNRRLVTAGLLRLSNWWRFFRDRLRVSKDLGDEVTNLPDTNTHW
jgi:hypothetical protein